MFYRLRGALREVRAMLDFSLPEPPVFPLCKQCHTHFDSTLVPPEGERPAGGLCGPCVTLNRAPPESLEDKAARNRLLIYDLLQQASERAFLAGWDLHKFQDESAACFLAEIENAKN